MDTVTPRRRSEIMAAIRSKDTAPELAVRRALHASGLRCRLYEKKLPGRPDLVFARRRVCLFVHGCFWHGCPHCIDGRRAVKSNTGYWSAKIAGNRERDGRHQAALEAAGWTVIIFWECMSRDPAALQELAATIRAINPRPA
jgi:DNA mismatch endonuclease (patch repair protein)